MKLPHFIPKLKHRRNSSRHSLVSSACMRRTPFQSFSFGAVLMFCAVIIGFLGVRSLQLWLNRPLQVMHNIPQFCLSGKINTKRQVHDS
jgi:hypothetical protein